MSTKKQLLHLVIGGQMKKTDNIEFADLSRIDFVGAYGSREEAEKAWRAAAHKTVDDAHMRYFILHAHRLLDPDTGTSHSV